MIPSSRPVVGFNVAKNFNEVVAMDLTFFHGSIILDMINHVNRFSAAAIVKSTKPEDIIEKIFEIWINIFGPHKSFLVTMAESSTTSTTARCLKL